MNGLRITDRPQGWIGSTIKIDWPIQTAIEFRPMQPGASFSLKTPKAQLEKARAAHGR